MPRLSAFVLLVSVLLIIEAESAQADSARAKSPVVHICVANNAAETTLVWTPNVVRAVGGIQPIVSEALPFAIRPATMSDCEPLTASERRVSACYGRAGDVYCDAEALAMLLRTVAWLSAFSAVPKSRSDGSVAQFDHMPVLAAQALAYAAMTRNDDDFREAVSSIVYEGGLSSEDFDRVQITFIATHHLDITDELLPIADEADTRIAYSIYFSTVNYLMAFIIGHELYHAHSGCGTTRPSSSETSGTFDVVTKLQTSGRPLCPEPPVMGEVLADRCALRVLERMDTALTELAMGAGEHVTILLSLSRRYAIDAVGVLLLHGLGYDFSREFELDDNEVRQKVHLTAGYLHPPLRLMLVAKLLNNLEPNHKSQVALCSYTAQSYFYALLQAAYQCSDPDPSKLDINGVLTAFEHTLPQRTIEAFRVTGRTSERDIDHFRCE